MATYYHDQPQSVDSVEDEINRFFDRIVECVDFRRRALIAEAGEKIEEKRVGIVNKQQSEQQILELKTETERKLKENILREIQVEILAKLEEKLSEVGLQEPETRLVFQGDSGQLEKMILGLGEILEQEIPAIPRYQDLKVTVAVGRKGLGDGEIYEPQAIAIDDNTNNIFIAEGQPSKSARISIYSETGEFLKSFGQEHLKYPHGIAIHGNNVYVIDWGTHRVYQFKQETDIRLVTSIGGRGSKNSKLHAPTQVSVSTNGDVYVADWGNHRIQIMNSSLHFIRSLSHSSMTWPYDVKLTQDEIYVLSTGDPHCIHVFSHTGEKIRSLVTRGDGRQVTRGFNFCMDASKNLIISDSAANCIKVFSNEGSLLHTISEYGHEKGMLEYPQGISLTKDLKLVIVSGNEKYGLQIFS